MFAQYLDLKAAAPADALLFFRMGDFYELFFDDAATAAAVLDIALTRRGQHLGQDVPMCGVPVHAAPAYLARLVRAGHRVAVAEQTEDPAAAKRAGRPVARAIARIVTAATLTEEGLLDARAANWLAAIAPACPPAVPPGVQRFGLAWADVSTGRFHTSDLAAGALDAELARIGPAELVADEGWTSRPAASVAMSAATPAAARSRLLALSDIATLDGLGHFTDAELIAAAMLVAYLDRTHAGRPPRLDAPRPTPAAGHMAIDAATRASLELARANGAAGGRAGSLLGAIDRTLTGPGARLLAADLGAPLVDPAAIEARLAGVARFADPAYPDADALRAAARSGLRALPDLERALGRLGAGRGGARDLGLVCDGLARAAALAAALADAVDPPASLGELRPALIRLDPLARLLAGALAAEPVEGAAIASGHDPELDRMRAEGGDGRRAIAALEARYRAATGVAALKIRHNGVIGYHVEAPARADAACRAAGLIPRQSLAGTVRFGSDALAQLARRIASAADAAAAREAEHVARLTEAVLALAAPIAAAAAALARLDVATSLAELARAERWVRPVVDGSTAFHVVGGRHPVVEAALKAARAPFVANDCDLAAAKRLWLVTGPNMGGKSTFLRQNALIAILAQAGSYVPAVSAHIGVVDRLFSRVGAADDLARGRSTFMVEMVETAAILNQATPRSLVILDEVGRGTATYDGLAIAWAVLEHLHDHVGARALFATHYHELTRLSARLDALHLVTLRAREWRGELVFLHEVAEGAADRSYGLAVARLAGVPAPVLARARAVLDRLETERPTIEIAGDLPLFAAAAPAAVPPDRLRAALAGLDPDTLSPREAHGWIEELKRLA